MEHRKDRMDGTDRLKTVSAVGKTDDADDDDDDGRSLHPSRTYNGFFQLPLRQ